MGLTSVDQLLFFADELEKLSSSPEETLLPKVKGLRSPRLAMPRPASVGVKARPQNAFSGNWVRPMTTNKVASVYAEAFERMTEAEKLSNIAPAVTAGKGAANVIGNIFKKVKSVATKTPTVTPTAPGVTQLGRTTRAQPLPSQTPTQAVQTPPREVNPPMRVEAKPQRTPAEDVKWAKNRAERQRQIETTNPGKQVSFSSTGAPRVSAPAPRDKYFQGLERSGRTYRGADARPLSGRGASLTSRADEILDANLTDEWISQHPKRARALRKRKESLLISEGVSPEEAVRRSTREPLTNEDWIERTWNPKPKQETQGQRASRLYESGATQVAPSPVRGPSKAPTPEATPAARPLTGSGGKPGQTPVAPDAPIPTPYESGVTQVAPTQFLQERLKRGARRPGATAAEAYESGVTQVAPSPVRGPSKAPTPEATPAARASGETLIPAQEGMTYARRIPGQEAPLTGVTRRGQPATGRLDPAEVEAMRAQRAAAQAEGAPTQVMPRETPTEMLTPGQRAQQAYEGGATQAVQRPAAKPSAPDVTPPKATPGADTTQAMTPERLQALQTESGATQVIPRTKPGRKAKKSTVAKPKPPEPKAAPDTTRIVRKRMAPGPKENPTNTRRPLQSVDDSSIPKTTEPGAGPKVVDPDAPTPKFDPEKQVGAGGQLAEGHTLNKAQQTAVQNPLGNQAYRKAHAEGLSESEALGAAEAAFAGRPLTPGQKAVAALSMAPAIGMATVPLAGAMGVQALSDHGQPKMGSLTGVSLRSYRR